MCMCAYMYMSECICMCVLHFSIKMLSYLQIIANWCVLLIYHTVCGAKIFTFKDFYTKKIAQECRV